MVSLEDGDLTDYAVIWSKLSFDSNGNPTLDDPEEIRVRWEKLATEVIAPTNSPNTSEFTIFVDRDIAIGTQMRLGKLSEITNPLDQVHEVVYFEKIPDVKGRKYRRTVTLIKKRN